MPVRWIFAAYKGSQLPRAGSAPHSTSASNETPAPAYEAHTTASHLHHASHPDAKVRLHNRYVSLLHCQLPLLTNPGAGPSGLTAAKTLANHHDTLPSPTPTFTTTLYDTHTSPGGLWPSSRTDTTRPIPPSMTANLTRHTMQFSDLAWPDALPPFPRAWMVGEYLARYARTYLEGRENVEMSLGRRVVCARRRRQGGWVVESEGQDGRRQRAYDYLVVASGYFGEKRVPEWAGDVIDGDRRVPVVHSTEFRGLEGLLGEDNPGRTILVAGGQMSGVETASSIAAELSSAVHSPGQSPIRNPEEYAVHHLSDRHTWVMPLFTTPTVRRPPPPFYPRTL